MAEIIKTYKEKLPATTFIGKCYTDADRENGSFGAKWGEWFGNGWFETLEALPMPEGGDGSYLGLMTGGGGQDFHYWIGVFCEKGTKAPDGYQTVEFDEGEAAVCWIKGREDTGELFGMHDACMAKWHEQGWEGSARSCGEPVEWVAIERYNCPRYTEPDEQGEVILDYLMYI